MFYILGNILGISNPPEDIPSNALTLAGEPLTLGGEVLTIGS